MAINKVILIGNVGKDPEIKSLSNNSTVVNFSIATSESWKDKSTNERVERTEWHNIVIFGKLAELAAQYVKKGRKIYIEGKLKTDSYEKQGVKCYSTKIIADSMQLLDKANTSQAAVDYREASGGNPVISFDEDIPF